MTRTGSLSKYYKIIAMHYKDLYLIGLIVFIRDLIKLVVKGINNIDKLDLLIDLTIYVVFCAIVSIIRKKARIK
ncbi:MAG: hypothetical protein K0R54_3187 [Clostridiaceae bacterium]|jgi:hypothetical protein|nr:hypothetical protein [Clostridiaceae bacterium]